MDTLNSGTMLYLRMPLPYNFSYRGGPLSLSLNKVQAHLEASLVQRQTTAMKQAGNKASHNILLGKGLAFNL